MMKLSGTTDREDKIGMERDQLIYNMKYDVYTIANNSNSH